jgi:hypothetical protein
MTTKSEAVRMDETNSNNQELTADDLRGVQGGSLEIPLGDLPTSFKDVIPWLCFPPIRTGPLL